MRLNHGIGLLCLAALAPACVALSTHQALQRENDDLAQALLTQQGAGQEGAARQGDRIVALALQNHRLKIERSELKRNIREKGDFYDSVTRDLRREIAAGRLKVGQYQGTVVVDVSDDLLFDSGRIDIKAAGRRVLMTISRAIAKTDRTIRVVGHTDNEAMSAGAAFASNWELSTARATSVVRFIQDSGGLAPQRLLAAGRGEWKPVASNATEAGRQMNRRITISLVDQGFFDGSEPIPTSTEQVQSAID